MSFAALLLAVSGLALAPVHAAAQAKGQRWLEDFELAREFSLAVDVDGFEYPSAIAFVPNPGSAPDSPLYFVTELRGAVKVVTRDRKVHTFAKDFFKLPSMPAMAESTRLPELGMAGIALEPARGYVFVSFTYHDAGGAIRNGIARFITTPQTFGLKPTEMRSFSDIFAQQVGDDSHMIGPLLIHEDLLYVGVGDAHAPSLTQELHSTAGKVLRMTLDGDPLPDNPHFQDASRTRAANYVWARGLRNPFGLAMVGGRLFANDVGPNVDRFLEIKRGGNYGYDGSDWSIGSHADVSFAPSVAPVSLVFHAPDGGPFPSGPHRSRFYLVTSGEQRQTGPSDHGDKAVLTIAYDFTNSEVIGRPHTILKYVGNQSLMPVGMAIGPDGLYICVLSPVRGVRTPILKLTHDASDSYPRKIANTDELIRRHGCEGCHRDEPGAPGPPLEPRQLVPRLLHRLSSEEYETASKALDAVATEPAMSYREARRLVREAEGVQKVRVWIKNRLLEPRFDMPHAVMPNLGLKAWEADALAVWLTAVPEPTTLDRMREQLADWVPKPRQRHLLLFLAMGLGAGGAGGLLIGVVVSRLRRSR